MRRSGRSMNRKDRDRGAEMRLTERTGKLIPETRRGVPVNNRLKFEIEIVHDLSCHPIHTKESVTMSVKNKLNVL